MQLALPLYVEIHPAPGGRSSYAVRPLFAGAPECRAATLATALEQLRRKVGELLRELGEAADHGALAAWLDGPEDYAGRCHALRLEGPGGSQLRQVYLVSQQALGRELVFVPRWPRRHFEVAPGESLVATAQAVLSRWLKLAPKQPELPELEELALPPGSSARLGLLELDWIPVHGRARAGGPPRAGLGGPPGSGKDGAAELRKVGRRLNDDWPQDLPRALGRAAEVAELDRLLMNPRERRPLLLLGPAQVGKTALLQEWLQQHLDSARSGAHDRLQLWQLAPQRLISGMSFLGEWEERLLAILRHAERQRTVLVFDDLPGLFSAGISSGSELNVGTLLLPWLEQRRVRVVAEITPEAWGRLRERQRRFADQFVVLPVAEPDPAMRWQILAALMRQLEQAWPIEFSLDAVPAALELCQRFAPGAAFPGRIASFLRQLAQRTAGSGQVGAASLIDRTAVLAEFARGAGLELALVDSRQGLSGAQIQAGLRRRLAGQEPALAALGAALARYKAGLNDPGRPLAVFLLIGPTGVGKTQCAKAVAEFLGGSAQRLLRFDLNEYGNPGDAARLVGTPRQPEGLLTAAIRRQPAAVLLFDEVEKAAPEVYDLLLALLDEGRLTDALGRVADFTQAVVLLTSNLGAREAQVQLGFGPAAARAPLYREAARKWFRPEFFNRLDEVLAFEPFARTELERIATGLVEAVLARSGMRARRSLLQVDPEALARLVDGAADPLLGARALKRGVERVLAQPLARLLAAQADSAPALLRLRLQDGELLLQGEVLQWPALAPAAPADPAAVDDLGRIGAGLQQVEAELDTLDAALAASAPPSAVGLQQLDPATRHYFDCREQLYRVRQLAQRLRHALEPRPGRGRPKVPPGVASGLLERATVLAPGDLHGWQSAQPAPRREDPLAPLRRELAWLRALQAAPAGAPAVLLQAEAFGAAPQALAALWRDSLVGACNVLPGLHAEALASSAPHHAALRIAGPAASVLAAAEAGRWLRMEADGALTVLQAWPDDMPAATRPGTLLRLCDGRRLADLRGTLEVALPVAPVALARLLLEALAQRQALETGR